MTSRPTEDLSLVVERVGARWEAIRDRTVFLTGATGFVGQLLLEALVAANHRLDLGTRIVALSRKPERFLAERPQLAAVRWLCGDIRDASLETGPLDFVFHGAVEASPAYLSANPLEAMDTIYLGTRRVLDVAKRFGARRLLFLSSGAVYGKSVKAPDGYAEECKYAPSLDEPSSAYGEAKRLAEVACRVVAGSGGPDVVTARLFAVVGPEAPMRQGYAIGDFVADALGTSDTLSMTGDGRDVRSFLYTGDLAAWLWTLLLDPRARGAYNVGSDVPTTLAALADAVAAARKRVFPSRPPLRVQTGAPTGRPATRYFPNIAKARALGLEPWTPLESALEKTLRALDG